MSSNGYQGRSVQHVPGREAEESENRARDAYLKKRDPLYLGPSTPVSSSALGTYTGFRACPLDVRQRCKVTHAHWVGRAAAGTVTAYFGLYRATEVGPDGFVARLSAEAEVSQATGGASGFRHVLELSRPVILDPRHLWLAAIVHAASALASNAVGAVCPMWASTSLLTLPSEWGYKKGLTQVPLSSLNVAISTQALTRTGARLLT